MTEENKTEELTMPKHLDEIVGTKAEVLMKKTQLITKFGLPAYEELVARSGLGTKR